MKFVPNTSLSNVAASHENPLDPGVLKKVLLSHLDGIGGNIQMINWATLLPLKSFEKHAHVDMREIFILTEGNATATVNQEQIPMQKGDMLIVDPTEMHSMKNETGTPVLFLAIGIV